MFRIRGLAVALAALAVAVAHAQSFNIDLDVGFGPPEGGNGAPSSQFGAAAASQGVWNRVYGGGPTTPVNLLDLGGNTTAVLMWATGGVGSYGGYNNASNTGDYALLLNDFAEVAGTSGNQYHFSGLQPGLYLIYTYAVSPVGAVTAQVTVPGSTSSNPQFVTGPMPGNQFALGITHSLHELLLTGSSFEIDVGVPGPPNPRVNGFQIVAVPEPSIFLIFGIAAALLSRRRQPM